MSQPRALASSCAIWLSLAQPLQAWQSSAARPDAEPQAAIPGPAVGDPAPDFELGSASNPELRLPLAAWLDGRPLALVFGSSTSPELAGAAERLNELALDYGEEVTFLFVYLAEAAAPAGPDSQDRGAATLAERRARCAAAAIAFGFPFPAVVDELDERVGRAYSAHPERLFLIDPGGRVAFAGGPGVDPSALELAILEQLTGSAPPAAPERRHAEAGILRALDADGDGTLSPAEIDGASAVLRGFDLDGDGTLISAELRRATGAGRPIQSTPASAPATEPAPAQSTTEVRPPAEPPAHSAEPAQPLQQGPAGERSIDSFDYDRDGRLSRIEVPRALLERWETLDRNDDGYLDAGEQATLGAREPRGGG